MDLQEKYIVKKVTHPHAITAEVPGSKSITNRALLIAALATGKSVLRGVLFSDDSRHFLAALTDLGFDVEINEAEREVSITGCGGQIPKKEATVNVGSAGTAARFLTAFLGLSDGKYRMDASEQMKKRPMQELLTALESLGAEVTYEEEKYHFPFLIGNNKYGLTDNSAQEIDKASGRKDVTGNRNIKRNAQEERIPADNETNDRIPDEITIDIDKSSQFLSALLIVSVLFPHGLTIHVTGSHGMAYVKMTVEMMRQFGLAVEVSENERTYFVKAGASYQPRDYRIEPDLSAACYFYAAGAILGVPAKVLHVHKDSLQGDIQFLSVLCDMGCKLSEDADGITILPPDNIQRAMSAGIVSTGTELTKTDLNETDSAGTVSKGRLCGGSWDLSAFSDQALTLAAIAPFADSMVEIRGVGHIRYQECDRIHAILENLHAMGVQCEEADGTIRIYPMASSDEDCPSNYQKSDQNEAINSGYGIHLHGAMIQTYEDHRVAMAFTIPGLLLEEQVILNPSCCRKTFEDFFEVLEAVVYR